MTLTANNAHNLLSARDLLGGQNYADTFVTAENAAVVVVSLTEGAITPGALRFAAAVIIGAGNNGDISPEDALDCLSYVCGLI